MKEREAVVKLLLAHQANANATNKYGRTPLYYATSYYNRTSNIVALLLAAKAEPNVTSFRGETPLLMAACFGNDGAVKLLLEHGAQVNVFGVHGWTPLHGAAWCNHIKSVRLLLAQMPVNTPDARGNTALHYAMEHGSVDICTLLLASGAEVNAANHEGVTPLFHAIKPNFPGHFERRQLAGIQLLLTKNAEVNVTNIFGETLFQAALKRGNTNTIRLLRQHGAKE